MPSDETLFAAFRAHRDCQALAALFHRRVDELLRLAVFLAPRPSDAEDLVQATFLSAIARAETFRPGHRVMSWLCGILTNQARMLRRAERRTRPQPEAQPTDVADDPAAAALQSELRQALQHAIAELPEPYRSVLSLHLENGLDSHEISQRLARPPATVRKQMERALDRLRTALPVGLGVALAARVDAAELARHAAEAARYVGPELDAQEAPAPDPSALSWPWRVTAWLALPAALGVALLVARTQPAPEPAPGAPATHEDAALVAAAAPAANAHAASLALALRQPQAAASATLDVRVLGADGAPRRDFEVQLVPDTGQALPERLVTGASRSVRTDERGVATFAELRPGGYDVAWPGAVVKRNVAVTATSECTLEVPADLAVAGVVVDGEGQPVVDAEIVASESSLRGDLGTVVARSGADGSFRGTVTLATGRLFARHPDHRGSIGARLEADRTTRLTVLRERREVVVTVHDAGARPIAGAYVAIAPRSVATALLAPQHGRTDATGCCTFGDPGDVEATVLASHAGFAPATHDLAADSTAVDLRMGRGHTLCGVLVDDAGAPVGSQLVRVSLADQRSNEPVAPLLARAARTAADGTFTFPELPAGSVQVQVHGKLPAAPGLMPFPWLLAAADVEVAADAPPLRLVTAATPPLRGRLQRPDGSGIAGWNVVAVPQDGSALLRAFRARGAPTGADGSFVVHGLAPGETYDLGAFVPGAPRRRDASFPFAIGAGFPGAAPAVLECEPAAPPHAALRVRVLGPDGQPCPGAELELRAVRCQLPQSRTAAHDGTCTFAPLLAGEYWLAIVAPGLGTRTLVVAIGGDDVDLGTITLEPAARLFVRVGSARGATPAGLRVVARNVLGDKFVSAVTDANGAVVLPALPPGETRIAVHGPGYAPVEQTVELAAGHQWRDVTVDDAATVSLVFPFALADNPFVVNGPLQVRVTRADGTVVVEDHLGAVTARGRFDCALGLPPGDYEVAARSIWGAHGEARFTVAAGRDAAPVVARLRR
jgi:RNA polymerase sigma-70 factor (ECF subfamily)